MYQGTTTPLLMGANARRRPLRSAPTDLGRQRCECDLAVRTTMATRPRRRSPLPAEPMLVPPPETLYRYNARVLDPSSALTLPGQPPLRTTVYLGDRLLVTRNLPDAHRDVLDEAAKL